MILDITFVNGFPIQIQGVRKTNIYQYKGGETELVIHYQERKPQESIPLKDIHSLAITND